MAEPQGSNIVDEKRIAIRDAMAALGPAIGPGDDRELLRWVIPCLLAVAHRPFRYDHLHCG
jgi:hypothetical protein